MKEHENVEEDIRNALRRAAQQGQPVAELLEAVARVEEVDAWFEPGTNGHWSLVITTKETKK